MSNENNTASEMQHPELDIVDRLLTKPPLYTLTNMDLCEAAQQIVEMRESLKSAHAVATAFATKIQELEAENKELHEMVDDLSGWVAGVEADNDTLRKEIARLKEERNEIRRSFCQMVSDYEADAHGNMDTSKEQVATNNGWDCFKEESK
jgi:predicted nuclease with TOPRIM domain